MTLTDRENYPTFFRTVAPDSSHNAAKAAFVDHFGWHEVSSLMQDEELFSLVSDIPKGGELKALDTLGYC